MNNSFKPETLESFQELVIPVFHDLDHDLFSTDNMYELFKHVACTYMEQDHLPFDEVIQPSIEYVVEFFSDLTA